MATTDLYTVAGSLYPMRRCIRFLGGDVDDGIQIDTLAAAIVAGNHTKGTITAWINCPDNSGTYTIIGAGDADAAEYMHFIIVAGKLRFRVYDGGAVRVQVDSTNEVIPPHQWVHVAVVQDASRPYLYVNGKLVAMTDTTMTEPGQWFDDTDGIDGMHIGASDSIAGDAALTLEYRGYISDVKVWSGTASTAALTPEQIDADFRGASNTTSLLAHYTWNDRTINVANPGTYDGTTVGAIIYCDANEFASKLTYGAGTAVTADNISIALNGSMGFAFVVQQA